MKHWNNAAAEQRTAEQYPSQSAVLSVVEAAYTPAGPAQHGLFSNQDENITIDLHALGAPEPAMQ